MEYPYELTEFVLNNKDVINQYLEHELAPFKVTERVFSACPEVYEDWLSEKTLSLLRHYLLKILTQYNYEDLLQIDNKFVKIYLQN